MRHAVLALGLLSAGCFGAPTLPPHLGEGTTLLEPGRVSLNVAAGGGAGAGQDVAGKYDAQGGGGFEVRLRSGIGAKSELGISIFGGIGSVIGNGDPPFLLGGKLSYKLAPLPWLAFVADAGAMDFRVSATAVFSGDLAVIAAPYTGLNGEQLYVAVKGAFSVPVLQGSSNVDEALILPVGFQLPTSKRVRLVLEAGPIFGFTQQTPNLPASSIAFAGYGVVAFNFQLR